MFDDVNFWISISFIGFLALCFRPTKAFLSEVLNQRVQKISNDFLLASNTKLQAQNLLAQAQAQESQINLEIAAIKTRALEEVETIKEKAQERLKSLVLAKEQYIKRRLLNQEKAMELECITQVINNAFTLLEEKLTTDAAANDNGKILEDFSQSLSLLFDK
jgi:F0F1-type ATP synthase membrane subunit b/b'